MQQDEVIKDALRNAPPSSLAGGPVGLVDGEKAVHAADLGGVDAAVITEWVNTNGGRTYDPAGTAVEAGDAAIARGDVFWVVPEAALEL